MPTFLFYLFTVLAVSGALALVAFRNPVSSAMAMVVSFIGLAALFIGLNAYFVGIIQILVYAGAIMVLFLFIIMLLDVKAEEHKSFRPAAVVAGIVIPLLFLVQLVGVLGSTPGREPEPLALREAAADFEDNPTIRDNLQRDSLPDVHLVGLTLFGSRADNPTLKSPGFNFPLQVIGILLLVATVGVVVLSRRPGGGQQGASSEPQTPTNQQRGTDREASHQ